ncbi:signal peptide peptidase SppA [Hyphococcus formosus]|uniref:signal peptide peptidase SppA n=1 Tax=Hyphococcus formosus TaxID=3143534 RepID=UPI00398A5CF0
MSDHESKFTVWGFVKGFAKLVIGTLLLLQGLIGLVVLLLFVGVLVSVTNGIADAEGDKVSVSIPDGAALVLDPNGVLVEMTEEVNPLEVFRDEAYGINEPSQISVHDIVKVIRGAKDDKRIKGIVLDLGSFGASMSSASKLHYINDELVKFKESGKKIVAVGDYYSQDQYLLASTADEIYMNDYGNLVVYGYGAYGPYFKSFLEKLKITSHVFRVGTFKSAIEPFIRDDMSPEAKEANRAYLDVLWREYANRVNTARGLEPGTIENYANNLGPIMRSVDGDFAKAALETGLVDELMSRAEMNEKLIELFGKSKDGKSFKKVGFQRYLVAQDGPTDGSAPNIAVVTAAGTIVDGEAPVGRAVGGDTLAATLKKAREDEKVKAVVLRIDSPGGSAFASDIIRDEILALKKAGKPIVASMGSLAASGGYWIAADADEIWASPTTITGSIGIFGYFNTFENTAAEVGIFVDGVGTTTLAPMLATGVGPLPETGSEIIQLSVENGYDRFLTVVGNGRGLEKSYVDEVGQGRVWIGERAKDLRLVDNLGTFDDAIVAAAKLAKLDKYDIVDLREKRTPFEILLGNLSVKASAALGLGTSEQSRGMVTKLLKAVEDQTVFFEEFNDPNGAYARCITCE